jgi:hypothetical protein
MTDLPPEFILDAPLPQSQPAPPQPLRFRPLGVEDPPQHPLELLSAIHDQLYAPSARAQFAAPLPNGGNLRTAREGLSPSVATKGEAALNGFAKSATLDFRDELRGLLAAGGFNPDNPDDGPQGDIALVKGAYRLLNGDPDAEAAYRVAVSQSREKEERLRAQQPNAMLAGEIAGEVATLPLGGPLAKGAGLGARTLRAARAGWRR